MRSSAIQSRPLRLEALETRTLLAGIGFEEEVTQVTPAFSGIGTYAFEFNPRVGRGEIIVTGSPTGSLSLNFDLLPDYVTNLKVSGFETVSFTGVDKLSKLVVTDVKTLTAPGISLDFALYTDNVGSISLAHSGNLAVLKGDATKLEIAKLDNTLIISDLQKLTLLSKSEHVDIVSLNSTQVVKVLYQPTTIAVAGLESASQQILLLPNGETAAPTTPEPGIIIAATSNVQTDTLIARLREIVRSTNLRTHAIGLDRLTIPTLGLMADHTPLHLLAAAPVLPALSAPSFIGSTGIPALTAAPFAPTTISTLGQMELAGVSENWAQAPVTDLPPTAEWLHEGTSPFILPEDGMFLMENDTGMAAPWSAAADDLHLANDEGMPSFADLVLDGIVAEILPGEQTAFLLVDPKPPRSAAQHERDPLPSGLI